MNTWQKQPSSSSPFSDGERKDESEFKGISLTLSLSLFATSNSPGPSFSKTGIQVTGLGVKPVF
jgi:hypothetical protein